VDATGFGTNPAVGAMTPGIAAQFFFMIDTASLSARAALNYDPATPANSYFGIALANGMSATPEFYITPSVADFYVPLDMNSNAITAVDDPTNAQDVATKNYVDGLSYVDIDDLLPSQTGNSGEFLTTDGTNASWASVSASPGGSDTQIQFNNSGAFAGDSRLLWLDWAWGGGAFGKYLQVGTSSQGQGILMPKVNKESWVAIGAQGNYGNDYARDEPHIALNTVRISGDGSSGIATFRNASNGNTIYVRAYGGQFDRYVTASNGIIGFYLTENGGNNAATITMASSDQGFFARKARLQVQAESGLISADATINTIQAKAQTSQTGNLFDGVDTSGTSLWSVDITGAMKPASMADSAAANNRVYYSTDASKLVYKDSGGSVNNLY